MKNESLQEIIKNAAYDEYLFKRAFKYRASIFLMLNKRKEKTLNKIFATHFEKPFSPPEFQVFIKWLASQLRGSPFIFIRKLSLWRLLL